LVSAMKNNFSYHSKDSLCQEREIIWDEVLDPIESHIQLREPPFFFWRNFDKK
jgi:hypothetical protein